MALLSICLFVFAWQDLPDILGKVDPDTGYNIGAWLDQQEDRIRELKEGIGNPSKQAKGVTYFEYGVQVEGLTSPHLVSIPSVLELILDNLDIHEQALLGRGFSRRELTTLDGGVEISKAMRRVEAKFHALASDLEGKKVSDEKILEMWDHFDAETEEAKRDEVVAFFKKLSPISQRALISYMQEQAKFSGSTYSTRTPEQIKQFVKVVREKWGIR